MREVLKALVATSMIVALDKSLDLVLKACRMNIVFQQNAILLGLIPSFNLAQILWTVKGSPNMLHSLVAQPLGQIA